VELQDLRWEGKLNGEFSEYYAISDASILLPRNGDGLIMRNLKQLGTIPDDWITFTATPPGGDYFPNTLQFIYNDDSYWQGTVRDPVNWVDDYWDEVGIDRQVIKDFLDKHPRCRI
jgi:hypothetical protein